MKNVSVFAYATFGSPNGFTQSCIFGNKSLEKILKTFDLKTNAIQLLSPVDRIYSIRKELVQKNVLISYSVYTFAKEKNSNRGGTFIGTSLVFTNQIPEENKTLTSLHGIHQNLKNANTTSNILNVSHSKDFNLQDIYPKDFEKLSFDNEAVNFSDWTELDKNLVVFVDKLTPNCIQNVFKKSLFLLSHFSTVYFIDSKEIADFVSQKKLFQLVDFEGLNQEIKNLETEKKLQLQKKISELEKTKTVLEENRQKQHSDFEAKINFNIEKQAENEKKIEQSKENLIAFDTLYEGFSSQISQIIANLKTNNKLEEAQIFYKQQKNNFEQALRKIENPSSIQSISTPKISSPDAPKYPNNERAKNEENLHQRKTPKLDVSKIISFALNVLLIAGFAVFFFFFNNKKPVETAEEISNFEVNTTADSLASKLNPFPNDSLKAADYKLLYKKLNKNAEINDLVNLIFDENPTNVGVVYKFQKEDYKNLLLEKNPESFTKINDSTFIVKDSVKIIPSFRDKN